MTRREYVGNAAATTLNGAIAAGTLTIVITDGTNWPAGTNPFVVIIDRGLAAEEKVLITSRSGNTLTVNTRGFDSTTAASHANGATIEHGLSAKDIDEVNDHVFDTTNDDHTQYLNTTRHDVEARHTFGAGLGTSATPSVVEGDLATSSIGTGANPAREDHVHGFLNEVWDTWVPTLTNLTLGNGTVVARFVRIGRTIHYRFIFTLGSTSAVGTNPQFTSPVTLAGYTADAEPIGDGQANDITGSRFRTQVWMVTTTNLRIIHWDAASTAQNITATVPFTWATGDVLTVTGTFQAAS